MKKLIPILIFCVLSACTADKEDAQGIVDVAIATAGGDKLNNTEIEFIFRDKEYGAMHKDGRFEYVRIFKDSSDLVRDMYTNDGFKREINGEEVSVPDSMATKYSNSINSVIYFALLPIGLNDAAVIKAYMGSTTIGSQDYHKIKVTFKEEGGGTDYEDVFIYWINKNTDEVDYLAYEYHTEGGGMRFREAYNERYVGGIRFVDYINYKPASSVKLDDIDKAFIDGNLEELSRIELQNIKVNALAE